MYIPVGRSAGAIPAVLPIRFGADDPDAGAAVYLADPAVRRLVEFFNRKGLAALKQEDRQERWYDDWIAYQAQHGLYAGLLTPAALSSRGTRFDLLKLTRFWEAATYFSPAHAYSLHVTFLGLFPFLRSSNDALKREAIASLEAGGLFAFAVSERDHGADLLGNGFGVAEISPGRLVASGSKYYIGNAHAAAMISVLARRTDRDDVATRRAPMMFFALRPAESPALQNVRKIHTIGVRTAFVASLDVKGHEFPASDILCDGRQAWEAVFATVNLGKFFLGFSSIGMCEHALAETVGHIGTRILYGRPVSRMPHIRVVMAHAYARLTAMKFYAYRALDYVHAASADDRRYLLFVAVQKAQVSTQGVRVMSLLSECIGARGVEADTYFETALRDVPLVPTLEGSTHINYQVIARLSVAYFARCTPRRVTLPPSLAMLGNAAGENPYLLEAAENDLRQVTFAECLAAYRPLKQVSNVMVFVTQVLRFWRFMRCRPLALHPRNNSEVVIALGKCVGVIAYAQLVAEQCVLAGAEPPLVSLLFHQMIEDLSIESARLAALPQIDPSARRILGYVAALPQTSQGDLDDVADRVTRGEVRVASDVPDAAG